MLLKAGLERLVNLNCANGGQTSFLSMNDMRSKALDIDQINVTDKWSASAAIERVNAALTKVSAQRSSLGAVQNRLEHTINNLTTASENLSSAESRIRDVDMAKEMMELTKNNILSQASQAMLARSHCLITSHCLFFGVNLAFHSVGLSLCFRK